MKKIQRNKYLAYASNLKREEIKQIATYVLWLPDQIIDCHAHCNLDIHVKSLSPTVYNHMMSTFPSFNLDESESWTKVLLPGKDVQHLRFPHAFPGIDHRAANTYLLENSPDKDLVAIYGIPNDIPYTIETLNHPRASALKMYYLYLDPPAKDVYQFFPTQVLKEAERLKKPIILHLPSPLPQCVDQVERLAQDFPELKICLAHLGVCETVTSELESAFRKIRPYPNINMDTALVPSSKVVSLAYDVLGLKRIMYGSDAPLNLIRSVWYQNPELGTRLATEFPYHWANPSEYVKYKHLALNSIHAQWTALGAIHSFFDGKWGPERIQAKLAIFHSNAKIFFGFPDYEPTRPCNTIPNLQNSNEQTLK
ncbi:MAG: amidohydrolase family protein [Alphaproteobacteria bacterium]|nr:amidohydrolase family protein [Alphaproteobacteria bacterium]